MTKEITVKREELFALAQRAGAQAGHPGNANVERGRLGDLIERLAHAAAAGPLILKVI